MKPALHPQEEERLEKLYEYSILDCIREKDFDGLTALAAKLFNTPISFINLVDKHQQLTKSFVGCDLTTIPREIAFCSYTILQKDPVMVVEDATKDERFSSNPLVQGEPHIRFYAGAQLLTENNLPLGSFCVIGREPRGFSEDECNLLTDLSKQAMNLVRNRKVRYELELTNEDLERRNENLKNFASTAAHDVQAPLTTVLRLAQLLQRRNRDKLLGRDLEILNHIMIATKNLRKLVSGLLEYSTTNTLGDIRKEPIIIEDFFAEMRTLLTNAPPQMRIEVRTDLKMILQNVAIVKQILLNLIGNAINHRDKEELLVEIGIDENDTHHLFYVKDNGPGIPKDKQNDVFKIFAVLEKTYNEDGERHYGIGLATVKRLVSYADGSLSLDSEPGMGATFSFTLRK